MKTWGIALRPTVTLIGFVPWDGKRNYWRALSTLADEADWQFYRVRDGDETEAGSWNDCKVGLMTRITAFPSENGGCDLFISCEYELIKGVLVDLDD